MRLLTDKEDEEHRKKRTNADAGYGNYNNIYGKSSKGYYNIKGKGNWRSNSNGNW